MRFLNKRVLITGAASGIGRASASRFLDEGAAVACLDINAAELDKAVSALRDGSRRAFGVVADVGRPEDVERGVGEALRQLGGIDVLVNNAGAGASGSVHQLTHEAWERTVAVNLSSFFWMSKQVWTHFVRQRRGVILNTSSIMGITGARNSFAYCACKAGVIALTRSLAADGGPLGIRANCICPGFVRTPIMDRTHSAEMQAKICQQLPARRMATPEEVANGFLYLASDEAGYANGAVLVLDGAATVGFGGNYVNPD